MNANFFRIMMALGLAAALPVHGGTGSQDDAAKERWASVHTLKIGDSEDLVRAKMQSCVQKDAQFLIKEYERVRQPLQGQSMACWLVYTNRGLEFFVIAVFSNERKLVDLLSFDPPTRLVPLLPGIYTERLESIKAGMNIDDVYRLVGPQSPEFYRRRGKDWRIMFMYQGPDRDGYFYSADAASGTILRVSHQSLAVQTVGRSPASERPEW